MAGHPRPRGPSVVNGSSGASRGSALPAWLHGNIDRHRLDRRQSERTARLVQAARPTAVDCKQAASDLPDGRFLAALIPAAEATERFPSSPVSCKPCALIDSGSVPRLSVTAPVEGACSAQRITRELVKLPSQTIQVPRCRQLLDPLPGTLEGCNAWLHAGQRALPGSNALRLGTAVLWLLQSNVR